MEYIYIIIAALVIFVFIAIIIGVAEVRSSQRTKRYTVSDKGEKGENIVASILGNTIIGQQYVINDLLFCNSLGQSCQIDHIFINKFGIWVIETKNYSGTIYGQENQREWTQVLAFGNEKNPFYNPIKQNATHIYHLSEYLNVKNIFQNVVVFLANADISNISFQNIYTVKELECIKVKNTNITLSAEKMSYYYYKLLELKNSNSISKEEHIENIHNMQNNLQQGICPRCGGTLKLRNGKYGQFYGCSNYPKCKFTKQL